MLEIVEALCQRSMIFCTQYQSESWYTCIDPNPDSGSPISEAIMDRIIHNAYDVLVEDLVSMRGQKAMRRMSDCPFHPSDSPCELEMDLMILRKAERESMEIFYATRRNYAFI